ncbi:hypothetical protein AAMO2058_001548800 [Amorphochlora amoebiformis]
MHPENAAKRPVAMGNSTCRQRGALACHSNCVRKPEVKRTGGDEKELSREEILREYERESILLSPPKLPSAGVQVRSRRKHERVKSVSFPVARKTQRRLDRSRSRDKVDELGPNGLPFTQSGPSTPNEFVAVAEAHNEKACREIVQDSKNWVSGDSNWNWVLFVQDGRSPHLEEVIAYSTSTVGSVKQAYLQNYPNDDEVRFFIKCNKIPANLNRPLSMNAHWIELEDHHIIKHYRQLFSGAKICARRSSSFDRVPSTIQAQIRTPTPTQTQTRTTVNAVKASQLPLHSNFAVDSRLIKSGTVEPMKGSFEAEHLDTMSNTRSTSCSFNACRNACVSPIAVFR